MQARVSHPAKECSVERARNIEARLRRMMDMVADGRLPRRDFMQHMATLGLAAPLVNSMLASAGQAQVQAPFVYRPTRRGGGGALKILMWQGPVLLNQHLGNGLKDHDAAHLFYEPLARYDADGEVQPVLAAETPTRDNGGLSPDGRSTTWRLKKWVNWHDGQPFSADDVVFTWQFATDPGTAAFTAGAYKGVKVVEKIDASTVRFVFDQPSPLVYRAANIQILPRHLYASFIGAKAREAPTNGKPVGTGPYRCIDFRPGDLVRGELNPNYHLPNRPHFDSIEIKGGGDATTAARAVLQTGEYDFAWNLQVEDEVLRRIEAGGKGYLHYAVGGDTEFIMLNAADPWTELDGERAHPRSRHPLLSDAAVREALRLLADRPGMQAYVYGRAAVATANFLNNPERYNSRQFALDTSIDKANAVLDAAGWKRGADGQRSKDGRKLHLVFQTTVNSVRQKVQAIYKQACAKAGIELEIKAVNGAVFFSGDVGNPDTNGKFWADLQMYTQTRIPDPDRWMQVFVSWEASSRANKWLGINTSRWTHAEYDRLFRASELELDPLRRAALFIRMNDLAIAGGHIIPLFVRANVSAFRHGVMAPMSGWDIPLSAIHDWYRQG
jgi:peptide/nickel transport system substrate-binding protein